MHEALGTILSTAKEEEEDEEGEKEEDEEGEEEEVEEFPRTTHLLSSTGV
jgi:hypothetical protein